LHIHQISKSRIAVSLLSYISNLGSTSIIVSLQWIPMNQSLHIYELHWRVLLIYLSNGCLTFQIHSI